MEMKTIKDENRMGQYRRRRKIFLATKEKQKQKDYVYRNSREIEKI